MANTTTTTTTAIEWKSGKGFEGQYEVSNTGLIKSLKGKEEKILKSRVHSKTGYVTVVLSDNGSKYSRLVHRLVAEAFIENPENKPEVNHIDENKENNNLSNLEWNTHKENSNHGTKNIRSANKQSMAIVGADEFGNIKEVYSSLQSAERISGFRHGSISNVINGRRNSYRGLVWYKIDNDMFNLFVSAE